jgi:SAM-dependent methyltransferase
MSDNGYDRKVVDKHRWGSMTGRLPPDLVEFLDSGLEPGSVLEVGCGGGWYAQHFGKDHDVVACDIHDDFLTVPPDSRRFRFQKADAMSLPFADKEFRNCYSVDVLEHVDDDAIALREMARVTDGPILLVVPRKADEVRDFRLAFLPYFDLTHRRYYDEDSIRELCAQAGLKDPEIIPTSPVLLNELYAANSLERKFPARIPAELVPFLWLGALKEGLKALPSEGFLHPNTWYRRNLRRLFGSTFNRFRPIYTEYRIRIPSRA